MQAGQPNIATIVVMVAVICLGLLFRMRRMAVARPLRPGTLWVIPALFVGIAALNFFQFPPHGLDWAWIGLALVLGAAAGWQRGRLTKIWIEPENHTLMSQGSGWAIVFLVVLIVLRSLIRAGLGMEMGGAITPALVNDTFVVFAVGLFGVQRLEMALRAQRLMRERAAGAAAEPR
jgi:hypothetical protein